MLKMTTAFSTLATVLAAVAAGCGSNVAVSTASMAAGSTTGNGGGSSVMAGAGGAPVDCSLPQMTTLASKQQQPGPLAVDATNIYWVNLGPYDDNLARIFSLPKAGGTPVELASSIGTPMTLVVDETRIYWSVVAYPPDDGLIYSVPKTGGSVMKLYASSDLIYGLTADEQNLYWIHGNGSTGAGGGAKLSSMPKDGGAAVELASGAAKDHWDSIAVDQDRVYWLTASGKALAATPKLGGDSVVLSAPMAGIERFALDETRAYWGGLGLDGVVAMPKSGGAETTIIPDADEPYALVFSGPCAYWDVIPQNAYKHGIHAGPRSGGTPVHLFDLGMDGEVSLTADDMGIYWSVKNDGTILRATK